MLHTPIAVKPLPGYQLLLTFDHHEQRIFDVAPYLSDVFFAPLRQRAVFNTLKANALTMEWIGGIDLCSDELYYNSKPFA